MRNTTEHTTSVRANNLLKTCLLRILYIIIITLHRRHPNILLRRLFVFNYSFDDPLANSMMTPLMARIKDPASLVIFPPNGTCGNTNSSTDIADYTSSTSSSDPQQQSLQPQQQLQQQSQQQQVQRPQQSEAEQQGVNMVDVHLNEVMSHAALHIVLALEQQMRLCDDARSRNNLPEGLPLCTIFDDMDESSNGNTPRDFAGGTSSNSSSALNAGKSKKMASGMYKKKPAGRIHKWQGDLCMQACTPRDALDHYTAAIVDCKALGETLWLASALEGYASAVLLLLQMNANIEEILGKELKNMPPPGASASAITGAYTYTYTSSADGSTGGSESVAEKVMRLAEERIGEAVAIYGASIVYCALEVECLLRTARMHEQSPFHINRYC